MEEKNLFDTPSGSLFQLNLDAQNSYNLRSSASWAKVLGVSGIIVGIFFCIMTAIAISKMSNYNSRYGYRRRGGMDSLVGGDFGATSAGLWILIITAIIFILGGVFSLNFGNRINTALKTNDQQGLNTAFGALRNYYALRAITLIIVLLLMFISITSSI